MNGPERSWPRRIGPMLGNFGLGTALVVLIGMATAGVFDVRGSAAQDTLATPSASEAPSTVGVSGHGEVAVTPDTASVILGVTVTETSLSAAQEKATSQMTAVLDALKAAGVEDKDIQTVNYSVSVLQDYDQSGNPTAIKGYQISNLAQVTIRDLSKLGATLDTVVAKGANAVYGINFYVNDTTLAVSQARAMAVQDARRKADELAAAVGMKVGRVLSISESSSPTSVSNGQTSAPEASAAVPIQTGTMTVSVDVQVTYVLV